MAKEELLEFDGTVTEVLPDGNFRVKLDNEHEILAYTAGKMRKFRIRTGVGDRVVVEMSPYDLQRGRISFRHKSAAPPMIGSGQRRPQYRRWSRHVLRQPPRRADSRRARRRGRDAARRWLRSSARTSPECRRGPPRRAARLSPTCCGPCSPPPTCVRPPRSCRPSTSGAVCRAAVPPWQPPPARNRCGAPVRRVLPRV